MKKTKAKSRLVEEVMPAREYNVTLINSDAATEYVIESMGKFKAYVPKKYVKWLKSCEGVYKPNEKLAIESFVEKHGSELFCGGQGLQKQMEKTLGKTTTRRPAAAGSVSDKDPPGSVSDKDPPDHAAASGAQCLAQQRKDLQAELQKVRSEYEKAYKAALDRALAQQAQELARQKNQAIDGALANQRWEFESQEMTVPAAEQHRWIAWARRTLGCEPPSN